MCRVSSIKLQYDQTDVPPNNWTFNMTVVGKDAGQFVLEWNYKQAWYRNGSSAPAVFVGDLSSWPISRFLPPETGCRVRGCKSPSWSCALALRRANLPSLCKPYRFSTCVFLFDMGRVLGRLPTCGRCECSRGKNAPRVSAHHMHPHTFYLHLLVDPTPHLTLPTCIRPTQTAGLRYKYGRWLGLAGPVFLAQTPVSPRSPRSTR